MKIRHPFRPPVIILRSILLLLMVATASVAGVRLDTVAIETVTGLKGSYNAAEGVFKVTAPRTDVKIAVDGWPMPPFMGLTSWAAFEPVRSRGAMVMGDLVLFQDEVNPVMSVLLDNGLAVTALHNHFFYDDPRVYFMHISGEGTVERLARGVRQALDKVREIRGANPTPASGSGGAILPPSNAITAAPLERILGVQGQSKEGMFKVVLGRKAEMTCACEAGKEMGVNTWAAFAGSDDTALVDGDFAVYEDELQDVLKALRRAGIDIVAIHHHMTGEKPRMLFLHYWGRGSAASLARAVKSALDVQKPTPRRRGR